MTSKPGQTPKRRGIRRGQEPFIRVAERADDPIDFVQGMPVAHGRVPLFLKGLFSVLLITAFIYGITATEQYDRIQASSSALPTAAGGQAIVTTTCAACHNITTVRKIGPGLKGIAGRIGHAKLEDVLHHGIASQGMPNPSQAFGLNEVQLQSIALYLTSLK